MPTNFLAIKNKAKSGLAIGVSATGTSWALVTGGGSWFPDTFPFHITCENEIVACEAKIGDTLIVVRAQQGTVAASHSIGKSVELRITAKHIQDLNDAVNAIENSYVPMTFDNALGDFLSIVS